MESIQSTLNETVITVDYDDFTNTVEVQVGNESGFRYVNLDIQKCDQLIELLTESKNQIT